MFVCCRCHLLTTLRAISFNHPSVHCSRICKSLRSMPISLRVGRGRKAIAVRYLHEWPPSDISTLQPDSEWKCLFSAGRAHCEALFNCAISRQTIAVNTLAEGNVSQSRGGFYVRSETLRVESFDSKLMDCPMCWKSQNPLNDSIM